MKLTAAPNLQAGQASVRKAPGRLCRVGYTIPVAGLGLKSASVEVRHIGQSLGNKVHANSSQIGLLLSF